MFGVGGGILFVPVLVALGLGPARGAGDVAARDPPDGARRRVEPAALREPPRADGRSWSVSRRSSESSSAHALATQLPESTLRRLFAVLLFAVAAQLVLENAPREPRATLIRRDPPRRRDRRRCSSARRRSPPRHHLRGARRPARARSSCASRFPARTRCSLGDLEWPTSTTADVQSFQYPGRRLDRAASAARALRSSRRRERPPRRSRSPRRSSSRSSTARSSPAKVTASVSAGASARSAGADDDGLRGAGPARARPRRLERSRGARRSTDWGTLTVLSPDSGSRKAGPAGRAGVGDGAPHPR